MRDLHDGAQQRLVHTIITLKLAQRALGKDDGRLASLLAEALEHAEQGNAELRELAHGILPAVLTHGGLRAGVERLVSRLDLPVDVDVTRERLPPEIEASAYFIVAEALTNVVKHAQATRAEVTAAVDDGTLRLEVRDDGVGGRRPGRSRAAGHRRPRGRARRAAARSTARGAGGTVLAVRAAAVGRARASGSCARIVGALRSGHASMLMLIA